MELRGLFQYLVNELKRGQGIELVLLQVIKIYRLCQFWCTTQFFLSVTIWISCLKQELIQQMANVQYTENLTEEQLDAMAGGETLRYQATSFGVTRNNKVLWTYFSTITVSAFSVWFLTDFFYVVTFLILEICPNCLLKMPGILYYFSAEEFYIGLTLRNLGTFIIF